MSIVSARFVAAVVGLDFGAAAVVACIDGSDVAGVFATNVATPVVWGTLALILLVVAIALPRTSTRGR